MPEHLATRDLTGPDLEKIAVAVAGEAAAYVAANLGRTSVVGLKSSSTDAVTQVDLDTEALISRLLQEATPGSEFVGEERGVRGGEAELSWVVDPIDGTVNFLYGVPLFAVSIAAVREGRLVAGAVADVVQDQIYSAHRGGGARRGVELLRGSSCAALPDALVMTGFSYQAPRRVAQGDVARRVLGRARDLRCFGSTALELCWLAAGRADAYYQTDTQLWDWAAGALIAEEAGARVELPCPENEGLIIAAAPGLFEELRGAVTAHETFWSSDRPDA